MTIAEIRSIQNAELDVQALIFGETIDLTGEHNAEVTDALAKILEDTNPNHKYPPVNK